MLAKLSNAAFSNNFPLSKFLNLLGLSSSLSLIQNQAVSNSLCPFIPSNAGNLLAVIIPILCVNHSGEPWAKLYEFDDFLAFLVSLISIFTCVGVDAISVHAACPQKSALDPVPHGMKLGNIA